MTNNINGEHDLSEKALIRAAGRAAANAGRKARRPRPKKGEPAPEYDGDGDSMITNPLTGKDEIPWRKGEETAEEAIARFLQSQGSSGAQRRTLGQSIQEVNLRNAPKKKPDATPQPTSPTLDRERPPLAGAPVTGPKQNQPTDAVTGMPFFVWPQDENGKMKALDALTDEEVDQAANFWARMPPTSDQVKKLIDDIVKEKAKRDESRRAEAQRVAQEMAATEREMRGFLWENGKRWNPSNRWKYPNESYFVDGSETYGRLRDDFGALEVVSLDSILPGEDGFAVIGKLYDPDSDDFLDYDSSDTPHRTIEDAMKYAEDVLDALNAGDESIDAFDENKRPKPNQISEETSLPTTNPWSMPSPENKPARGKAGKLGSDARFHKWVPSDLDEARKLFEQKWADRRKNASIFENIDFAIDRLTELQMLSMRMDERYQAEFPGMNEAWNMSVDDFAQWAVRNGLFDTFAEARTYHAEVMDAWDQLGADQEEIGRMMSEIDDELQTQVRRAVEKAESGVEGFTSDVIQYFAQDTSLETLLKRSR